MNAAVVTDRFVYVTYIRASQQKVWDALQNPEFTRRYWFGQAGDAWKDAGAAWAIRKEDGSPSVSGTILELDPPHRVVLAWRNDYRPELTAEGLTTVTFELEARGDTVKLTVIHDMGRANSKSLGVYSEGWPMVLANLKSLLETGAVPSGVSAFIPG
jgi:uncharacterized protein YndB with AHSA1/START domain